MGSSCGGCFHTHRTRQDWKAERTDVERTFLGSLSEYDCGNEPRPAIGPESRSPRMHLHFISGADLSSPLNPLNLPNVDNVDNQITRVCPQQSGSLVLNRISVGSQERGPRMPPTSQGYALERLEVANAVLMIRQWKVPRADRGPPRSKDGACISLYTLT